MLVEFDNKLVERYIILNADLKEAYRVVTEIENERNEIENTLKLEVIKVLEDLGNDEDSYFDFLLEQELSLKNIPTNPLVDLIGLGLFSRDLIGK